MAKIEKPNFYKTRNNYGQYDLVSIFEAAEKRTLRHCNVATLALVQKTEEDNIYCLPFPIREGESPSTIKAWNIYNAKVEKNDIILVIFTDRDFRVNKDNVSENNIAQTSDNNLHEIEFGVAISISGLAGEKGDKGDKGDPGPKGDQGPKGDSGNSPYIGTNGNWWIGDFDTGVQALFVPALQENVPDENKVKVWLDSDDFPNDATITKPALAKATAFVTDDGSNKLTSTTSESADAVKAAALDFTEDSASKTTFTASESTSKTSSTTEGGLSFTTDSISTLTSAASETNTQSEEALNFTDDTSSTITFADNNSASK